MISEFVKSGIDWWQDLGDGILLTYCTRYTQRPHWSASIDFEDAKKLGRQAGVGATDIRVYEDNLDTAYLPNGHARSPKHKDRLSGIESILYERLLEAVK